MKAYSVSRAHYVENIVDSEMIGVDYGDVYPDELKQLMDEAKYCNENELYDYVTHIKNYCLNYKGVK